MKIFNISVSILCLMVWGTLLGKVPAEQLPDAGVQKLAEFSATFHSEIRPIIDAHCLACHDADSREADLDLSVFREIADVIRAPGLWEIILERVEAVEMPPKDADMPLSAGRRGQLLDWIHAVRNFEAERNAGDPGPVLARRLSNAEYDYSIRDLTGVDIRPTRSFPVDPANEAGFDNSGESLTMSPALMSKYLEAARFVVDHLVLTPEGIRFAPHSVMTDTDRDKYCVKRIVAFYERQPTDYADYFWGCWRIEQEELAGQTTSALQSTAEELRLSPKYLGLVWEVLHGEANEAGPLANLQQMWSQLAAEQAADRAQLLCRQMRDYVLEIRERFEPTVEDLEVEGVHKGTQAFVLWKNRQYAAHRREADLTKLDQRTSEDDAPSLAWGQLTDQYRQVGEDRKPRFLADCEKFCKTFPDAFYVSERGRDYLGKPKEQQEKGRLLSAGFHSMMGYFRDDEPLQALILDEAGNRELNRLWEELDFITAAPMRQYQGFLWFDRTDSRFMRDPVFDFARPEDKAALGEGMITRLAQVYLDKATASGGGEVALTAIAEYFRRINAEIRWVEQARLQAEPLHVEAVLTLAAKAYRRPLSDAEKRELSDFYEGLRTMDELTHEEAIQDMVVSVLMSPFFCYRIDLLSDTPDIRPLSDYELASRLSYFLWSSLPDDELLELAATSQLHEPSVLIEQTQRMLLDDRVRAFAVEFGGNWLDFRRFEEHNSVDRERFPEFDEDLRWAMFEEPIRFFVDLLQQNRSLGDFLFSKRVFVNAELARHYGMPEYSIPPGGWIEIDDATQYDRGGLLPMAVFLTKNAPGLRTSPVKRGYWVVRRLLGERIPPPPPNVPELPNDESQLGELSLREVLAEHRDHESCAGCHNRFDSIGLIFEGYGPIGERRTVDLGQRPVDTRADFPDGIERDGLDGLKAYLQEHREDDFVRNFNRKLLSYALGRSILLSDEVLLTQMRDASEQDGYRIHPLIETIVTSPQFLNKRGSAF